jgi:hypothetical protein
MPQIVHLSVKYSKPERTETTLWTVGRDRHFGQRGVAVDAGSDITAAYSLDWNGQFVSWHLVPSKELLVSINDARNATWVRSNRVTGSSDGQEPERTLRRCQILASGGLHHGLEQS